MRKLLTQEIIDSMVEDYSTGKYLIKELAEKYFNSILPVPSKRSIYVDCSSKSPCYRIRFDNPEDLKVIIPYLYNEEGYDLPRKKEKAYYAMKILNGEDIV